MEDRQANLFSFFFYHVLNVRTLQLERTAWGRGPVLLSFRGCQNLESYVHWKASQAKTHVLRGCPEDAALTNGIEAGSSDTSVHMRMCAKLGPVTSAQKPWACECLLLFLKFIFQLRLSVKFFFTEMPSWGEVLFTKMSSSTRSPGCTCGKKLLLSDMEIPLLRTWQETGPGTLRARYTILQKEKGIKQTHDERKWSLSYSKKMGSI